MSLGIREREWPRAMILMAELRPMTVQNLNGYSGKGIDGRNLDVTLGALAGVARVRAKGFGEKVSDFGPRRRRFASGGACDFLPPPLHNRPKQC